MSPGDAPAASRQAVDATRDTWGAPGKSFIFCSRSPQAGDHHLSSGTPHGLRPRRPEYPYPPQRTSASQYHASIPLLDKAIFHNPGRFDCVVTPHRVRHREGRTAAAARDGRLILGFEEQRRNPPVGPFVPARTQAKRPPDERQRTAGTGDEGKSPLPAARRSNRISKTKRLHDLDNTATLWGIRRSRRATFRRIIARGVAVQARRSSRAQERSSRELSHQALRASDLPALLGAFAPDQVLFIAEHDALLGDPLLGAEQMQRFPPGRFTSEGEALDAKGLRCCRMACPKCHLAIPSGLLELEPLFLSILGAPSSGKSYFLTAMTWELRRTLPVNFAIDFADAD